MHIGSIHVDPSVLASQGLGHAAHEGKAARPHVHAPRAGSFAQVMLQQQAPTRPDGHHLARVHAAQHQGRARRRHGGDPQFHADDAAYADAVAAALGHGHGKRPRPAQLGQTQSLVAASMGMFPMGQGSSSSDDEE